MIQKKTFPIVGMTCASCAKLLERKLGKVPGIVGASVNYGNEQAYVEIEDEKVTDKILADVVANEGYKAIIKGQNIEEIKRAELAKLKLKVISSVVISILILLCLLIR